MSLKVARKQVRRGDSGAKTCKHNKFCKPYGSRHA